MPSQEINSKATCCYRSRRIETRRDMPGNLAAAAPSGVMPQNLCTAFAESRIYPLLSNTYHDGTPQQSLITDTVNPAASIRTWKLSQKLAGSVAIALRTFFEGQ